MRCGKRYWRASYKKRGLGAMAKTEENPSGKICCKTCGRDTRNDHECSWCRSPHLDWLDGQQRRIQNTDARARSGLPQGVANYMGLWDDINED